MSNLETKKTYGLFASPINKKLISELNEKGESLLIFPTVTTEKTESTEKTENLLTNLSDFDWMIFTDVYSVDYFIELLRELEIDLFELDALAICALGESVADRLRFVQIHADLIPTKIDSESVSTTISEYTANQLHELRFLVLKEKLIGISFVENLKDAQASVEELAVYKAKVGEESTNIRLKTLLKNGAVDEFVVSTAEDLVSLKFLFPNEDLDTILNETKVSAISENAYQALLENGLRPLYFHYK